MKKFLMIPLFVIGLLSCTSHDDLVPSVEDASDEDIHNMYNMYRDQAQKAIGCTMNTLKSPNSRASDSSSTTGLKLVEYLVSLPSEKIYSLYNQYCTA